MTLLSWWLLALASVTLALLCAIADSALLAAHAADRSGSAPARPLADRERLHRSLSMARVLAYVIAGVTLGHAIGGAALGGSARTAAALVAIAAIVILTEGVGRDVGDMHARRALQVLT